MRLLATLAAVAAAALLACSGSAKKQPQGPGTDDVPTAVTCCIPTSADGVQHRDVMPEADCAEDMRAPVDECNVGPGENEPH